MVHVKLFDALRVSTLEKDMNEYLANVDEVNIIDIKITTVRENKGQNEHANYIGLILVRG